MNFKQLSNHLPGKGLFIRFVARAFRKLLSIYVFSYFRFCFEGRMWDLIVPIPDHCLSFYFEYHQFRYCLYVLLSTLLYRHQLCNRIA